MRKCPSGWKRDKDQTCRRSLQIASLPATERPGPQKACPTDPNDKYDEAYLNKPGISATQVLYVDAKAQSNGTGSKAAPFRTIQEATS
ncbi:MAG: hypothetical protein AAFO86_11885, partial [Pseudomonadota bacterium]